MAIALHRDTQATDRLIALARGGRTSEIAGNHRDPGVRRQAMFWLGQSRDPRALEFLEQILRQ